MPLLRGAGLLLLAPLLAIRLVTCSEQFSLKSAYINSFQIYQHALKLAHERNLTTDQAEELDRILEQQPNVIYDTLSKISGGQDGTIRQDSNGHLGFVFLQGPLNESQSMKLDQALIQHHLHFTKQIIHLLDLSPDDLQIQPWKSKIDEKIKFYLFGRLSRDSGKASDYINSVNIIYALIRTRLSELAYSGDLSAKQTISAKKVIHTLNKGEFYVEQD